MTTAELIEAYNDLNPMRTQCIYARPSIDYQPVDLSDEGYFRWQLTRFSISSTA